ncbi:MAG: hypothetical protein O2904_00315 [bacterium]|nr:hypothetical protein [bacterium]
MPTIDTEQSTGEMLDHLIAKSKDFIVQPDETNDYHRHIDPEFAQVLVGKLKEQLLSVEIFALHQEVKNRIILLNLGIIIHEWRTVIANCFRRVQFGPATAKGGMLTAQKTYAQLLQRDVLDGLYRDAETRLWAIDQPVEPYEL